MPGHARRIVLAITIICALAGSARAETETAPRVVATYFHRTLRCQTCLEIESLARYDVTEVMAGDVATGLLAWRRVNFDEKQNAHFEEEFELEGPSLVVALEAGGEVLKWVRLDRVWELYDEVEAFDAYVLGAVEEYLRDASEPAARRPESP